MGLLDGLSAGLTAATKGAAGAQQGQIAGSQLLRAIQMQGLDAAEKRAMIGMNTARAASFMHSASQPPPATVHQLADGTLVSVDHLGKATPITMAGGAPSPTKDPGGPVDLGAPPSPEPQQPVPLKGRVPTPKVTPHTFMENGQPVAGLVTENGHYLRADGSPATGKITPYTKPDKEPTDHFTFPTATGADGKPAVFKANTRTGDIQPTGVAAKGTGAGGLAAPIAAKVGQVGEMLKKATDLLGAQERLGVSVGNSASRDVAQNGLGIGHMRIPGTQGIGSMMVNKSPEYSTYQAALTPFVLAAAHALSGARINDEQTKQIRASIEIQPGESAPSRAQKHKNLIDLVNSIGGSLPAEAVAGQEDQMEPAAMAALRAAGYRGAKRAGAPPAISTAPRATYPGRPPLPPRGGAAKATADFGVFGPSEE